MDLFTKQLSNYCFGYGIPSQGGVQSVHRFTKKFTYEKYKTPEEEENAMLMRVCKIATHELAHMFGLGHCAWYECLQKGTNHLEQTDRHPPYFCPVCYRKLHKCVKWDHVKRYKALMELCDEFGGQFTKPQKYEKNKQSYRDWYAKRYEDLKAIQDKLPNGGSGSGGGAHLGLPPANNRRPPR